MGQPELLQTLSSGLEQLTRRTQNQEARICSLESAVSQLSETLWRLQSGGLEGTAAPGAAILLDQEGERHLPSHPPW